jgi:hypothetical protein
MRQDQKYLNRGLKIDVLFLFMFHETMKSDAIGSYANAGANAGANAMPNSECIGSDTAYYLWAFSIVVLFIVLTIFAILSAM